MRTDKREALNTRIPEYVFNRIHTDIGHATVCWEHPENAGILNTFELGDIAFELCHFVADLIEEEKNE